MKFEFYKDELCKVWYRDYIEVEAESYEEAVEKMRNYELNDLDNETSDSEIIFDSLEYMSVESNNGFATFEIVDPNNDEVLYDNVPKDKKE